MTSALYITKTNELGSWKPRFERLYFGNEFCESLMPTAQELREVLDFVKEKELDFSLVTGYLSDGGMERAAKLLEVLAEIKPDSEVVINDWGLLKISKQHSLNSVIGRLLVKQRKGPQILNVLKTLPEKTLEYFQGGFINDSFIELLKEQGVGRIELDKLVQGNVLDNIKDMRVSLYYPYSYITTSRFCFSNPKNRGEKNTLGIYPCAKECQSAFFLLENPIMKAPLLLKGNTVFLKNENEPLSNINGIIDRVIYQSGIPI